MGDDSYGDQFHNGPNGYGAQAEWMVGTAHGHTEVLNYYADLLGVAADTFEGADESGLA